ncbi:inositol phospholipid synthesis protein scs3p [Cyclospora cayetanensis]|uniref:Inositol phospholipid synthesis protein scs3p n=1 Tax=Cyclospora cayetanensis TaxID=88456 RepID=A0A1D3CRL7_9EIME|nr:inositol phospholipid synthesis protein scs3p [Cyclospora cayetanensis]
MARETTRGDHDKKSGLVVVSASTAGAAAAPPLAEARAAFRGVRQQIQQHKQQIQQPKQQMQQPKQQIESQPFEGQAELLGGDTGGDRRGSSKELPAESDDDILLLPRPSQQQQLPDRASALPAQPLQNQQQQNPPKGRNIQHAASAAVQAGAASVMGVVPSLASPGTTTAADFPSTCAAFPGECMQCSSLKASETQLLQSPPQQLPRQPLQQEAVCVPTPQAAGSPKAACCEMAFELILMQLLEQQQVTLSDPRGRLILYASALRAATGGLLPSAFLRLFDQEKQAPSAASAARLWEISVAPSETPPPGEVSEAAEYAQSEKGAFGSLPLVSLQPEFAAFGTPCYPLARFLHQRLLGWGGLQLHLLLLGGWGFSLFSAAPLTLVHVPRAAFLSLLILYRGICLYTGFNWLAYYSVICCCCLLMAYMTARFFHTPAERDALLLAAFAAGSNLAAAGQRDKKVPCCTAVGESARVLLGL